MIFDNFRCKFEDNFYIQFLDMEKFSKHTYYLPLQFTYFHMVCVFTVSVLSMFIFQIILLSISDLDKIMLNSISSICRTRGFNYAEKTYFLTSLALYIYIPKQGCRYFHWWARCNDSGVFLQRQNRSSIITSKSSSNNLSNENMSSRQNVN